jgi:transcriptional regulator
MYLPRYFEQTDVRALHGLIRSHPFGTLVTATATGMVANHVPFEIDPVPATFGTLRCHVARANPVWKELRLESEALVIFQGPDAYISPSWYATKQETGEVVPTWNYAIVHARGPIRIIEDREWLRGLVQRLTERHEAGSAEPWHVSDAPPVFIEQLLGAIVGIEIPIRTLNGKWKLSQNRPEADRTGIVTGLAEAGRESAEEMLQIMRGADSGENT